jgi:transposase
VDTFRLGDLPRKGVHVGGRTHPPYAPEFRAEAVRLARQEGNTASGVARDLGVAVETLRLWVKQADIDEGRRSDGLTTEEHGELARLRRRVRTLETERDILKKAAAFFAKETGATP